MNISAYPKGKVYIFIYGKNVCSFFVYFLFGV